MEVIYAIAPLLGVLAGIAVVYFESRWLKQKVPTFKPKATRYLISALILCVVFVLLVFRYGAEVKTLAYALLAMVLYVVTLTDIDTGKIPNGTLIIGVIVWLATVWFVVAPENDFGIGATFVSLFGNGFFAVFVDSMLAAAIIGGLTLIFSVVYEQITNHPSLGGGDIKLLFVIALYLGISASLFNLLLACLFGLIFGFIWRKAKEQHYLFSEVEEEELVDAFPERDNDIATFPFGPSIAIATMATLIIGPVFMGWLFS